MRTVAVVTGSRADYGIYRPVLRALQAAGDLRLRLLVCGMHLARAYGHTVDAIEADGFPIAERIVTLMASDTPEGIAKSMACGVAGFAQSFRSERPDLLLVLGDRYEMFAAVTAALPFAIPIAHLHGGELTEGLIDEAIRHAITKMSHLHFATADPHRDRIVRMGERPDRVLVTGAPGIDEILATERLTRPELEALIGIPLDPAPLLVTFHPQTLRFEDTGAHMAELTAALAMADRPVVFTYPNADTSAGTIIRAIEAYAREHPDARIVPNLSSRGYISLMGEAVAMVGNSSSGIIEAASFRLPVVNIGDRQRGRLRGANVIDVAPERGAIADAIARAVSPAFRTGLAGLANPYGDGRAAERIVAALRAVPLDRTLVEKRFYDGPGG